MKDNVIAPAAKAVELLRVQLLHAKLKSLGCVVTIVHDGLLIDAPPEVRSVAVRVVAEHQAEYV